MKPTLQGIVPPLITPLRGRDELDFAGLEHLVEHVLAGGVSGLFILGTTGEGPSLSYRLRRELIEHVCKLTNKRVPILVGITDTAFVESVNIARFAANCGVDAVVAAPPYYLPEGQPELQEYLDHLVPELPLPLYLYNMPSLTKVSIEMDTLLWALDHPKIIGLKDSSGDMAYFKSAVELIKQHRPEWPVLVGPEGKLLEALQLGGHGGVSGGANLFPHLYVKVVEAFQKGDLAKAQEYQKQIDRVGEAFYRVGKHSSAIIKGIKCVAYLQGICSDFLAEPFHKFRPAEREIIAARLQELQVELANVH